MTRAYLMGVTDARTYFKREGVSVAAFVAPDGRHVLLELDARLNQVGLIDPTYKREWVFAKLIHDCWPLRPLGGHGPTGREHDMSKSQYGEWEARGEKVDAAVYEVAGVHHLHGSQCLCGFESHRARSRTEHIIDVTLAALAHAGVLPRTDEERNGPELSAYLRSFTDPGSSEQDPGDV